MQKSPAYLILLSIAQLLSGCGVFEDEDEGDVRFITDGDSYQTGEIVTLELQNKSANRIGLNLCVVYLELERLDDGHWSELEGGLERPGGNNVCTAEQRMLGPGQSVKEDVLLSPVVQPGTYRISTEIEVNGGKSRVVQTNEFRVPE